jgi:pyruvate/2-oxoglutarate dehydrogenase complex dihydrolipoamide dehydrogenase (E3) component
MKTPHLDPIQSFDVAVIGGGSGGERVASQLTRASTTSTPMRVVVFEHALVGGECPYYACIPSKALLADANRSPIQKWSDAIARRDQLTSFRDDSGHAKDLAAEGITLVRDAATIVGPHTVAAGGLHYEVRHIVIATGSQPRSLGTVEVSPDVWTSAEALSSDVLPETLAIVGGGPVGCELAELFARFGTKVTIIDAADALLRDVEPAVSDALQEHLAELGVSFELSAKIGRIDGRQGRFSVALDGRDSVHVSHVIVAVGREPRLRDLGLETLGVDENDVVLDDIGRVTGVDSVWIVGDANGLAPYTHGANSQADIVAENIAGGAQAIRGQVMPRCVYTHPPVAAVGMTLATAHDAVPDSAIITRVTFGDIARPSTDDLGDGQLFVVADRETGAIVGASGIGSGLDELISQLSLAMETGWPVERLARLVQPFPTLSELIGLAYKQLATQRTSS